jgi:hypothetical protein
MLEEFVEQLAISSLLVSDLATATIVFKKKRYVPTTRYAGVKPSPAEVVGRDLGGGGTTGLDTNAGSVLPPRRARGNRRT